jgi:hypothetical protein
LKIFKSQDTETRKQLAKSYFPGASDATIQRMEEIINEE